MFARITTMFNCTEADLWAKIIEPRSLQFVASPLLTFRPLQGSEIADKWVVGKTYELRLYFFGVLPLGRHDIKLITLDQATNQIVSNEKGTLASRWNHTIRFHSHGPKTIQYSDEIEIQAGWLTIMIWAFAHVFYCHRQKRWRMLLKK